MGLRNSDEEEEEWKDCRSQRDQEQQNTVHRINQQVSQRLKLQLWSLYGSDLGPLFSQCFFSA